MKQHIRMGSGSAWWGDRVEPAALNAKHGELDVDIRAIHICIGLSIRRSVGNYSHDHYTFTDWRLLIAV